MSLFHSFFSFVFRLFKHKPFLHTQRNLISYNKTSYRHSTHRQTSLQQYTHHTFIHTHKHAHTLVRHSLRVSVCPLCSSQMRGGRGHPAPAWSKSWSGSSWHADALDDLEDRWAAHNKQEQCHQGWTNRRFLFSIFQCFGNISSRSNVFAVLVTCNPHSLFVCHGVWVSFGVEVFLLSTSPVNHT